MGDGHLEAAERLGEGDALLEEEIGALALERGVLLLLHDEDDVARDGAGSLVSLTLEGDLLVVHHALLDVHLQHLLLLHHLLAVALPALVLLADDLPGAAALVAHGLHLLNHTGRDLPDHDAHAAALAGTAVPRGAALATLAVALGAQHVLRQAQFLGHAVVQILQRHLEAVHDVLALALALATAAAAAAAAGTEGVTAEHGLEDVEGAAAAAAAHAALLQALRAVLIVNLLLLGIAEHLVRPGDLLELSDHGWGWGFWFSGCVWSVRGRSDRVWDGARGQIGRWRRRDQIVVFLTFSGSPPLSGWFLMAALRYAFLISLASAFLDTPRML